MKSILSTKKLKPNQRDLLLGSGIGVVDYNAIEIEFLDFEIPANLENVLVTSQNGAHNAINAVRNIPLIKISYSGEATVINKKRARVKYFCVGQKTKSLFEQNSFVVAKMANNSAELGQFIAEKYKGESFHYFCGEQRRDELPQILKDSNIKFHEVHCYKTVLKPKKFKQNWDGILFFSPSGVASFMLENKISSAIAFCIGETTANVARKYFNNVIIANVTSVESVIAKTVKTLK